MARWLVLSLLLAGCLAPGDGGSMPDAAAPRDLFMVSGASQLSETGLYADFSSRTLTPGVIAFAPRYPLWSDGSQKKRYLWLPPGTQIDTSQMDHWQFPVGTKIWKEFSIDGQVVETRLIEKKYPTPTGWWVISYVWNSERTKATAAPEGVDNVLGTSHKVPAQEDCMRCHSGVRDVAIGVSAIQLSVKDGQGLLWQLAVAGQLSHPPAHEFEVPGTGVVREALGYLHGNCGHCHNSESLLNLGKHPIPLKLRLLVGQLTPADTDTYLTGGSKAYHNIDGTMNSLVPGHPELSQLVNRMARRDDDAMPPVGTKQPDPAALKTITDWISSLDHF